MHLKDLVARHQHEFKQKVAQVFSEEYEMSVEQVLKKHGEVIAQYIQEKYRDVERAVSTILKSQRPVVLSIRRDPCSEEVCMICERDQPNIEDLRQLYGNRIVFLDVYDSSPEGTLYHIIHRSGEDEGEKLLPLTAVIHRGELIKYWSGRPVEVEEYWEYLDPLV
ncbi:MAG: hypothetical protein U9O85_01805 [Euryarchaeota archaeon]|nr:hypothetical protein [Euryarchaeota archaeon]